MREWLPSGTIVAGCQVSARLSASGVGEVYLAKHLSSGAEVALKLLPPELVGDERRSRRFLEVFSRVRQLRHPGICPVIEGGITEAGRPWVVTDYIKGQSLDLLGFGHQLSLAEVVEVVARIGEALEYGHQKGWLHLQVRPSNLMLTQGLKPLVLDYGEGLAFPPSISPDAAGEFGLTAGNAAYLSPELVSGERPDQRSDIFSLGVVLYELLAGHVPFVGSSVDEVLASVTLAQPLPLSEFRDDLPPELPGILGKALAKDPAERYQSMAEFVRDLRRMGERRLDRSGYPGSSLDAVAGMFEGGGSHGGTSVGDLRRSGLGRNRGTGRFAPASIIDDIRKAFQSLAANPDRKKRGSDGRMLVLTDRSFTKDLRDLLKAWWQRILAITLIAAGILWTLPLAKRLWSEKPEDAGKKAGLKASLVTSVGRVVDAAISPDGKTIAYSINEGDKRQVLLQGLDGKEFTRLAEITGGEIRGLTFSPDGKWITYLTTGKDGTTGLFRVSIGGGPAAGLVEDNAISSAAYSPDGRNYAWIASNPESNETMLMLTGADGGTRQISVRRSPQFFHPAGPAWSPDGRRIACVVKDAASSSYLRIVTISADGSGEEPVAAGRWSEIERLAWTRDAMFLSGVGPSRRTMQLWRIDQPSGVVHEITGERSEYHGLSLSADGTKMVSVQHESLSNIWVASSGDVNRPRQLTRDVGDGVNGLTWTADQRIVYVSTAGGRETIWITGLGTDREQALPVAPEGGAGGEYQPAVSSDGRLLAYVVDRENGTYIWRSEIERRNLRRVTDESMAFHPVFTHDGRKIVYSVLRGERRVIAALDVEGGAPRTLIEKQAWRPALSPDGTRLACNYLDQTTGRWLIAVLPVDGGIPISVFNAPGSWDRVVRWMPDGESIAYPVISGGVTNIVVQPLAGGAPEQMTSSRTGRIFDFAWSSSGQYIAFAQGWVSSDVVILTDFR